VIRLLQELFTGALDDVKATAEAADTPGRRAM
jgi:hypothetical protein